MQSRIIAACLTIAFLAAPVAAMPFLGAGDGTDAEQDQTIQVSGTEFSFDPSTIEVEQGETITFEFTNDGTTIHDFGGDFGRTETISPGETDDVTTTFDETGDVAFWCSVGGHRSQGMEGTITISAAEEDGADGDGSGDGDDDGAVADEDTSAIGFVALVGVLAVAGLLRRRT